LSGGWEVGLGNSFAVKTAEKNSCKGSHGEKIKQVPSSIQVLVGKAVAHQAKILHNQRTRENVHAPENFCR